MSTNNSYLYCFVDEQVHFQLLDDLLNRRQQTDETLGKAIASSFEKADSLKTRNRPKIWKVKSYFVFFVSCI